MITFPNVKINLGLNVVERRPDGYHNIESVFYPLPLADMLEFAFPPQADEPLMWESSGIDCGADMERNLCVRAFRLLAAECDLPPVAMHLHKNVPTGAGLGGGSSDGTFVLCRLNELLHLGLSSQKLRDMAVRLGADCPFFVDNRPAAVSGIGEILEPFDVPQLCGKQIVLVKPDAFVSTPQAYAGIKPCRPKKHIVDILRQDIETWKDELRNDFEENVFALHPVIARVKESLYDRGALYAQMSGSGASVFGIFRQGAALPTAADYPGMFFWSGDL